MAKIWKNIVTLAGMATSKRYLSGNDGMVPTRIQNSFCTRGENMKKMIAVLALFAFGMMVGCGDDTKPKSGSTTAEPEAAR